MDSFNGSHREWTLQSPSADIFERKNRVDVFQPRLKFFNRGVPGATLRADRGRLDTASRDMWADGSVVMVSTDGVRLETDFMRYDSASDRFLSTAPVTLTRGASRVTGVGWEARPDLSEMIVRQERGELASEDTPFLTKP